MIDIELVFELRMVLGWQICSPYLGLSRYGQLACSIFDESMTSGTFVIWHDSAQGLQEGQGNLSDAAIPARIQFVDSAIIVCACTAPTLVISAAGVDSQNDLSCSDCEEKRTRSSWRKISFFRFSSS